MLRDDYMDKLLELRRQLYGDVPDGSTVAVDVGRVFRTLDDLLILLLKDRGEQP